MRILALDLAGATGWARLSEAGLHSGVARLKLRDDEHPGARWKRARKWFRSMADGAVDLIAWERIVANSGPLASGELFGLQSQLVEVAHDLKLDCMTVAPSTLKKFATGNGRAKKPEILAAARKRWPEQDIETHDQADALFVLAWAREQIGART